MIIRRKVVWLMILMIWVGMVTSIIVYQGSEYGSLESAATDSVEIVKGGNETQVLESSPEDINFTKADETEKETDKNFFIEYRLERDKARSEQINIFREMINNPNTDKAAKKEAQNKMLELTDKMEKEMEIESLIRARDYKDALAYIHDGTVDIIIQASGLNKEDAAKIGDIIHKTSGFSFNDMTIIEKKINN
ncbi:MAG: SpoIIIAH-like family protein [Halothermotrichaceae bacterium]